MAAYTWKYVRTDKLTPDILDGLIEKAIDNESNLTFGRLDKLPFKDAVGRWIEAYNDKYDFMVGELRFPFEKLSEECLTKQLANHLKKYRFRMRCYEKCLNGEMSIDDVIRKTCQVRHGLGILVLKRNGNYYANIAHEVFRNYEYCKEEFSTVDSLIEHCRRSNGLNFMCEDECKLHEWNQRTEDKVRDFYSNIGDNNFIVQFI